MLFVDIAVVASAPVNSCDAVLVSTWDLLVTGVPLSVEMVGAVETVLVSKSVVVSGLIFVDASGASCVVVIH